VTGAKAAPERNNPPVQIEGDHDMATKSNDAIDAATKLAQANAAKAAAIQALEEADFGVAQATEQMNQSEAAEAARRRVEISIRFTEIAWRRVAAAAKIEEAFAAVMSAIAEYDQTGTELMATGLVPWTGSQEIRDHGRLVFVIPERLQRIACANGAPVLPQRGNTFAQREAMIWHLPPPSDAPSVKAA
jgi:hypothetical protein